MLDSRQVLLLLKRRPILRNLYRCTVIGLKMFINIFDIMFLSLLFYVLTSLFNTYSLLFSFIDRYFITFNKL